MSDSLFDAYGTRKYIVPRERMAFVGAALQTEEEFAAFCLTLAITGARISEVLALGIGGVDVGGEGIVFRTLKQRGTKKKFRLVPVPNFLLDRLLALGDGRPEGRLWSFRRTYAWRAVKVVMRSAGISEAQCKPKALRHGFAVDAVLNGVPLNILQRWMGHARMETTAIYAGVLGKEERQLATRLWESLNCNSSASPVRIARLAISPQITSTKEDTNRSPFTFERVPDTFSTDGFDIFSEESKMSKESLTTEVAIGASGNKSLVISGDIPNLHDDPEKVHQLLDLLGLPKGTQVRLTTTASSVIVR